MTVLVAAKQGDKVILASDKRVSLWQYANTMSKQFNKRGLTFAACGNGRGIQVVQNLLVVPPWTEDDTQDGYMFKIVQAIKVLLKEHGLLITKNDVTWMGCSFLVIGMEKLYRIEQDFFCLSSDTFISDGCGMDMAAGAFYAQSADKSLRKRVETSIKIASKLSLFCGNGVDIKELKS